MEFLTLSLINLKTIYNLT